MRLRLPRNPWPDQWRDLLITAGWLVALELENFSVDHRHRSVVAFGLVVGAMGLAALWRRRAPLWFALVALAATTVLVVAWHHTTLFVAPLFLMAFVPYTAARECSGARARVALGSVLAWQIVVDLTGAFNAAGSIAGLVITGTCWGAGHWLRARHLLDAELKRRAAGIEAERSSRERLAVADERTRIARELHTLIAANISAMVIQAEAAAMLLERDERAADAAMAVAEQTGRDALADMRRMLGVLRRSDEHSPLLPQPGVGDIYGLVEAARDRGQAIELTVDGEPAPLPASVDLGVYRMLEEILVASGLEHADVRLRFGDDDIQLEMSGLRAETSPSWPTRAMSERAALCLATIRMEDDVAAQRLVVTFPKRLEEVFG